MASFAGACYGYTWKLIDVRFWIVRRRQARLAAARAASTGIAAILAAVRLFQ